MLQSARMRRFNTAVVVLSVVVVAVLTLLDGYSPDPIVRWLQFLAVVGFGAIVIGGVVVLALVRLGDWHSPASEDEFDEIVRRTELLAGTGSWGAAEDYEDSGDVFADELADAQADADFRALVRSAIDQLPLEFHRALEHVAIVVADGGAEVQVGPGRRGAYGLYQGDTVAHDYFHDRILIFRDTLVRDFGHDPELLRAEVVRTLRHELAHHLGWNERGVRDLGL